MRLILLENSLDIFASQEEKYDLVISVASGKSDIGHIKLWLKDRISENES
jgi:death on curing protein